MGEPVVLRRNFQYVFTCVVYTIFGVPLTLATLGMLVEKVWVGAIICGAFAAFIDYSLYGQIRVRVEADHDGLTLRQIYRVRHIAWSDVDHISPATEDWQKYVGIVLKDGRRIRCAALGAGRGERATKLNPYVERLNELLLAARSGQL